MCRKTLTWNIQSCQQIYICSVTIENISIRRDPGRRNDPSPDQRVSKILVRGSDKSTAAALLVAIFFGAVRGVFADTSNCSRQPKCLATLHEAIGLGTYLVLPPVIFLLCLSSLRQTTHSCCCCCC
ncbi:hypothetical protein FN846DRAFT_283468 [Sphaerosporella brunnea]|uniref:Uncharacterized protein n=1 Tax=Sphaerosporella brunnea TaxID=1250544 RepID=A0A5J5EKP9_9PEZI|nr:hypothetical protein FN846DRAFT_283468 [Sphaerosporella brunnea]